MYSCKICNSKDIKLSLTNCKDLEYSIKGKFNFIECNNCNILSLYPSPKIKEILTFYTSDYHAYIHSASKLINFLNKLMLKKRAKLYKKLIGDKGDILEIGCADGNNFSILNKFGKWKFTGIEFNDKIAQRGRDKGRKIITGELEKIKFNSKKFDIIIMDNFIEHITDPKRTINAATKLLKHKGYLIGETPNTSSLDFLIFKKYWGGLHTPRHMHLFNTKNLIKLFKNYNLKMIKINYEINTGHLALSVQNFLQSKKIFCINIKNGRAFYYPLLLILFIPLNYLQKIFHITGSINFIVQNKR